MSAAAVAGGIALGAAAACCFDGAVALQALEARAVAERAVGAGLIARLVRRPRWLAATALAIAGWPLQIAALALAPLTLVQPSLAIGLVLLLVLGVRLLGEPARPRDLAAVAAIAAGLALLAWAAPENDHVHAGAVSLAAVLGGLAAIAVLPWVARLPGAGLVLAAGCGYAASGLTTKLLADALGGGAAEALAWAATTAAIAGLALVDEMAALQRVGAARVAAGAFALQTVVPVLLAPALTGEHWSRPVPTLIGLALVTGAALRLGTATAVSRLVAGAQEPR
jgi:drug/metabolite transporter (DMT)-like permease